MRNYRAYTLYYNDEAEMSKVTESESFAATGSFFRTDVLQEIMYWAQQEYDKSVLRWTVEAQASQLAQRGETDP